MLALQDADCTCLNDQPPKTTKTGKKPAPAPFGASKGAKQQKNPLFEATPKNFAIGELCVISSRDSF